jgi:threonine dehydratase
MDWRERIDRAYDRIRLDIHRTALVHSTSLSRLTGAEVFLKLENGQKTGSFKFRGALNKVRSLSAEEKKRGIVSASTGNHGLGISLAARLERVGLTLVLPKNIVQEKKRRLEQFGGEILQYGDSCDKAEIWARHLAGTTDRVFVSPYNDEEVIAGQGTIGLEISADLPNVAAVFVPIGGGGLASGIAAYLKSRGSATRVFGVEPVNSAFMAASLKVGKIVEIEEKETIAEALAGGIEPGAITFSLCRKWLDRIITVKETAIKKAMSLLFEEGRIVVEGAGALALAGLLEDPSGFQESPVVLVLSGGNISAQSFAEAISSTAGN